MTAASADASGVTLREATADDVSAVAAAFEAYRAFYGATGDLAATRAFLEARLLRGESILMVALHRDATTATDTVIGFTQLYPSFSSVALRRVYILNDLFVMPAWRRVRVARQLILYAASRAVAHGAIRLELATQHSNAPARRLYEELGFAPDTTFTHMSLSLPLPCTPVHRAGAS